MSDQCILFQISRHQYTAHYVHHDADGLQSDAVHLVLRASNEYEFIFQLLRLLLASMRIHRSIRQRFRLVLYWNYWPDRCWNPYGYNSPW